MGGEALLRGLKWQVGSMQHVLVLAVALAVLAAAGCTRGAESQEVAGLRVALSSQPSPVQVGENRLSARVTDRRGGTVPEARVQFFYWMLYTKFPTEPEQYVTVVEGALGGDGTYTATVNLGKPGTWKIVLKIYRPQQEPALVAYTVQVQGQA